LDERKPSNPENMAGSVRPAKAGGGPDDFFSKLNPEMRRPRPSDDAIAEALQVIQRLEAESRAHDQILPVEGAMDSAIWSCRLCRSSNPTAYRFCGQCGAPRDEAAVNPGARGAASESGTARQHYHHHYHHHYFTGGSEALQGLIGVPAGTAGPGPKAEVPRPPAVATPGVASKIEATIRKLTQDWVSACNTRQLDDLLAFYSPDALVLRSNYPPVRGTAAIREFFFSALDAGLGDVEMDTIRTGVTGEMAFEAGRCKMLVPIAVGKRREERGKYVIVFQRQASGEWQAVIDCWSSDLSLKVSSEPESRPNTPVPPVPRLPRKSA
jgi:ketosteroid isomerase-like protein